MPKNQLSSRLIVGRLAPAAVIGVLFFLFMTTGNVVSTQSNSVVNQDFSARGMYRGVKVAERFDVSPPLTTLIGYPAKEERERSKFEERNNIRSGPLGPQEPDEAVQSVTTPFAPLVMPTPILSFDAILGCTNGCSPPDPVGDVGPNHYVAMSNSQFRIFNKSGSSVFGPANINTIWAGFGGRCETENAGDPVVIYDQLDDRWILTQFTAAGPTYFNCVAISTTGNPTGTYYRYAFSTGTNFPDYPKYGMWNDALYISTREFAGAAFAGVGAYAVNRAQLVAGNPAAQVVSFLVAPGATAYNVGDGLLPSDLDGSTLAPVNSPNYFVGSMDNGAGYGAPSDALSFWKFTANFAVPASSTFLLTHTLPVAAVDTIPAFCSGRACIPQPSTTNRIDHLGYRQRPTWRLTYRNYGTHQSLVTNQSIEASTTMSGIRWYELRVNGAGTPSIFQQGTYAPGITDGIHRWMGSIAMDASGNMALGYSASNATIFPSVWYTGRLASDPAGTMPQGEAAIINGTGAQVTGTPNTTQRWGDYSSMNIDPTDDCTFWYVNEYYPVSDPNKWRMRIGSFKFPSCVGGSSPTPTATNTFTPTATATNTFTPTQTNTSTPTATNTFTPTATNTFTPTPTATNTFTPTATATNTFTPTNTSTNTATPTNSATNTPTPPPVISGTISYGNAIGSPATRFVSNVAVDGAGSPPVSDVTGSSGTYSLTGFGSGSYTVTPSKSGGLNSSISSFDAARIAQHVVGPPNLNTTQQIVADVSGNGGISSFDAAQVANYAVSLPNSGASGDWIFVPLNRTYSSVENDMPGEDYSALLMGEVSGNWTDSGARIENGRGPEREVEIKAPHLITQTGKEILIPVDIDGAAGKEIISYEFDLRYDSTAIQPQINPVDLTGTVSRGLSVVASTIEPGLLRVAVYGATPIEENGLLLNLKFIVVGEAGSSSSLNWERILLNEDVQATTTDGLVEISAADETQMFLSSKLDLVTLEFNPGIFSSH
ncbi:MAG: cohesin domain-containing protein [Pyrinomonadaceae bacterium]